MVDAEMGTGPGSSHAVAMNMDRKIEPQPFSLRTLFDSIDWDIGRLCYKLIILLFLVFSLANMYFYGLYVWRFTDEFHPESHQQLSGNNP